MEEGPAKGRTLSLSDANARFYLGNKGPKLSGIAVAVEYGSFVKAWVSKARRGELIDQQMATMTVGSLRVEVTMNSVGGLRFVRCRQASTASCCRMYPTKRNTRVSTGSPSPL